MIDNEHNCSLVDLLGGGVVGLHRGVKNGSKFRWPVFMGKRMAEWYMH